MERVALLELRFSNGQNGGGRVFLGVLGRYWGARVGHVTAALACYIRPRMLQDPIQLYIMSSRLVARCSWFALASLFIAFELVLLA